MTIFTYHIICTHTGIDASIVGAAGSEKVWFGNCPFCRQVTHTATNKPN